jgi:hypothetical protein
MVEPPGPIPNPEVKHCCADGSGAIGPVRVGRCQVYARFFPKRKESGFFCAQMLHSLRNTQITQLSNKIAKLDSALGLHYGQQGKLLDPGYGQMGADGLVKETHYCPVKSLHGVLEHL